ncbi:MAG: hypothetical protein WKF81_11635 [Thermomicrobiales bacterium]
MLSTTDLDPIKDVSSERNPLPASEHGSLSRELAAAYHTMIGFYRDQLHLTDHDAEVRTRGLDLTPTEADEQRERIWDQPADQTSWFDLQRLIERDPEAMVAVWAAIKAAAADELASGFRTAQALEWRGRPWQRARFLAIRDSFRADTPPQTGIQSALLDTAAAAFSDYLEWSEQLSVLTSSEVESERSRLSRDGFLTPPRLSMAEAIEQAAKAVDQAHARFLRTVKMLHELQRTTPSFFIGQAAQVNVGGQQVNVTDPQSVTSCRRDLSKSSGRGT